jgi:carbon storage regulator
MLVLSRRPGERLLIGEAVEVTILAVRGDQVSLGVSAPRDVPIHREELLERIRRENRRAARLNGSGEQSSDFTNPYRPLPYQRQPVPTG